MKELAPRAEQKLRHIGPNYAADPVILDFSGKKILLILRANGKWGFPGGFVDENNSSRMAAAAAAVREAREEATEHPLIGGDPVYRGDAGDDRSDANSWIETSAFLFHLPTTAEIRAGDDAEDVGWFDIDDLPANMHAAHEMIIKRTLDYRASRKQFGGIIEYSRDKQPVPGGFMKYDKSIAEHRGNTAFVKKMPRVGVVSPERSQQMRSYLEKEAGVMAHLRVHGFENVPTASIFRNGQLAMDALRPEDGWQWQAEAATLDAYIEDALAAFENLESMPLPPDVFDVEPSYESLVREGWDSLSDEDDAALVDFLADIPEEKIESARGFLGDIRSLRQAARTFDEPEEFVFCHLDMRQENLAWHPEKGVKTIDWSWAGPGLPGSDATSLLIDLHKNGHDVSRYLDHINLQHCYNLMGFWLAHSVLPNQGAPGLRTQQFISALNAYELLLATSEDRYGVGC